jgi:cyclophilin family peptidyl-prolyl cis-trans isomerase
MYGAHAAGRAGAFADVVKLGADSNDNVREAALSELVAAKRPEAVDVALDALTRPDYQLTLTAARALGGAPDKARAVTALHAALTRVNGDKRDTARDARDAILDRLKELGSPSTVPLPLPLPYQTVRWADAQQLRNSVLRFVMSGKGAFDLKLLIDEAPLAALRVATRAREGYYNGLTFHRVVPNFVIQGGSPGANEYAGDAPFMRDEVGLPPHRRGTVGISTRGRDTGDAQIFINLVDLPRLDHTYTVFAEVVRGMDVVDAILEGDVIERVEIVRSGS